MSDREYKPVAQSIEDFLVSVELLKLQFQILAVQVQDLTYFLQRYQE